MNPVNNRLANGFVIQTYQDPAQIYIQDKLPDFELMPQFLCDYPCSDCDPSTRDVCTACWQTENDPKFLMFYPDGTQTCKSYCDAGFTTNGHTDLHCEACDVSCATCFDNQ